MSMKPNLTNIIGFTEKLIYEKNRVPETLLRDDRAIGLGAVYLWSLCSRKLLLSSCMSTLTDPYERLL